MLSSPAKITAGMLRVFVVSPSFLFCILYAVYCLLLETAVCCIILKNFSISFGSRIGGLMGGSLVSSRLVHIPFAGIRRAFEKAAKRPNQGSL